MLTIALRQIDLAMSRDHPS